MENTRKKQVKASITKKDRFVVGIITVLRFFVILYLFVLLALNFFVDEIVFVGASALFGITPKIVLFSVVVLIVLSTFYITELILCLALVCNCKKVISWKVLQWKSLVVRKGRALSKRFRPTRIAPSISSARSNPQDKKHLIKMWICCMLGFYPCSPYRNDFRVNGKLFHLKMFVLEVVEVLLQCQNLLIYSSQGMQPNALLSYSILIALNCIICSALMLSNNPLLNRDMVIICDIIFDLVYAVVFPIVTIYPVLLQLLNDSPKSSQAGELEAKTLFAAEVLALTSIWEIFALLWPIMTMDSLLRDLRIILTPYFLLHQEEKHTVDVVLEKESVFESVGDGSIRDDDNSNTNTNAAISNIAPNQITGEELLNRTKETQVKAESKFHKDPNERPEHDGESTKSYILESSNAVATSASQAKSPVVNSNQQTLALQHACPINQTSQITASLLEENEPMKSKDPTILPFFHKSTSPFKPAYHRTRLVVLPSKNGAYPDCIIKLSTEESMKLKFSRCKRQSMDSVSSVASMTSSYISNSDLPNAAKSEEKKTVKSRITSIFRRKTLVNSSSPVPMDPEDRRQTLHDPTSIKHDVSLCNRFEESIAQNSYERKDESTKNHSKHTRELRLLEKRYYKTFEKEKEDMMKLQRRQMRSKTVSGKIASLFSKEIIVPSARCNRDHGSVLLDTNSVKKEASQNIHKARSNVIQEPQESPFARIGEIRQEERPENLQRSIQNVGKRRRSSLLGIPFYDSDGESPLNQSKTSSLVTAPTNANLVDSDYTSLRKKSDPKPLLTKSTLTQPKVHPTLQNQSKQDIEISPASCAPQEVFSAKEKMSCPRQANPHLNTKSQKQKKRTTYVLTRILPISIKTAKYARLCVAFLSILFGLSVVFHTWRNTNRSNCTEVVELQKICKVRAFPLFTTGSCFCVLAEIQCTNSSSINQAHMNETLVALSKESKDFLRIFSAIGCGLTNVPSAIGQFSRLQFLYLNHNKLNSLPEEIGSLARLNEIDLSFNQFSQVPPVVCKWEKMITLWMHYNQIVSIPDCLFNSQSLINLYLQYNKISELPQEHRVQSLVQTDGIQTLAEHSVIPIEPQRIRRMQEGIEITKLCPIYQIYISHNELEALPSWLSELKTLRSIDLDFNRRLSALPLNFEKLSNLRVLSVRFTNISRTSLESVVQIPSLRYLYMEGTSICEFSTNERSLSHEISYVRKGLHFDTHLENSFNVDERRLTKTLDDWIHKPKYGCHPQCGDICKEHWLGNKWCNYECNNEMCEWDRGDCGA